MTVEQLRLLISQLGDVLQWLDATDPGTLSTVTIADAMVVLRVELVRLVSELSQ